MLLRCVFKGNFLSEAFAFNVFAHNIGKISDGMEGRFYALQVVFSNRLQAFDNVVKVNGHFRNLFIGQPDACIRGNAAYVLFGEMLSHGIPSSFFMPKTAQL